MHYFGSFCCVLIIVLCLQSVRISAFPPFLVPCEIATRPNAAEQCTFPAIAAVAADTNYNSLYALFSPFQFSSVGSRRLMQFTNTVSYTVELTLSILSFLPFPASQIARSSIVMRQIDTIPGVEGSFRNQIRLSLPAYKTC